MPRLRFFDLRRERAQAKEAYELALSLCLSSRDNPETDPYHKGSFVRSVERDFAKFAAKAGSYQAYEVVIDGMSDTRLDCVWPSAKTRVLFPRLSPWRYVADRMEDPDHWTRLEFSDEEWLEGRAPFGHDIKTHLHLHEHDEESTIPTAHNLLSKRV